MYPKEKTWPHPTYTLGREADWTLIPGYMIPGLREYIEDGVEPGDFLQAVLKNDLKRSMDAADEINRHLLFNYVKFLHNYTPYNCWGSIDNYDQWIELGGLNGEAGGMPESRENPNDSV